MLHGIICIFPNISESAHNNGAGATGISPLVFS